MSSEIVKRLRGQEPSIINHWGRTELEQIAATEIERLEALVYAPGRWKCPKCNYTLLQANLNAHDGTVTARDTPGDKCPNCDSPLWRVSWKQEAEENLDTAERLHHENVGLRSSLATAREDAAKWHDQRAIETPDAFEMEFHQASAKALRAIQHKETEHEAD